MYCCCGRKIKDDFECDCDWESWTSIHDWPPDRKNKEKPFRLPKRDGEYLVRHGNGQGDRCESIQTFSYETRTITCGYTGKEFQVQWSGDDESQPYAWKELPEKESKNE